MKKKPQNWRNISDILGDTGSFNLKITSPATCSLDIRSMYTTEGKHMAEVDSFWGYPASKPLSSTAREKIRKAESGDLVLFPLFLFLLYEDFSNNKYTLMQ